MYSEVFASRIKLARERTGFTQVETAKRLNISRGALANYEIGNREPDYETLGMMAEYYGVSTDWLLGLGMQGSQPNYEKVSINNSTVGNIGDVENFYITPKRKRRIAKANPA